MKNQQFVTQLSKLAKEIILFNTKRKDLTHKQAMTKFYSIMRKYGIKQGTWSKNGGGRICNNFEWTMCHIAFMQIHHNNHELAELFGDGVPKDLLGYGRKPKFKMPKLPNK